MLQGAIIGLIVGIIMTVVMLLRRKGLQKQVLDLLARGDVAGARLYLDRKVPPVSKIPLNKINDQRDRMAALAAINDTAALEQEVAAHDGKLTATVQVDAVALFGIALRAGDPGPAVDRLDALATKMEQEGGALMGLVKKQTRAWADLGRGLQGQALTAEQRTAVGGLTNHGGLVQLLVWQGLYKAFEAAGTPEHGQQYRAQVQALTQAFD